MDESLAESRTLGKPTGGNAATPLISVVVATHNRAGRLKKLLRSFDEQTVPPDEFEVIVIDDGSTDETDRLLSENRTAIVIRNEFAEGPARARQKGWQTARGQFVAFTDDDCRADSRWLEFLLKAHRANPGVIVQGRTQPEPGETLRLANPLARTIRVDALGPFFETCNVSYPRALLEEVGGFNCRNPLRSGEDADLAMRALATGCGAVFADEAVISHAIEEQSLSEAIVAANRWASIVALVAEHRELRKAFPWRGFVWRETHGRLILALLGIGIATLSRRRLFLLWVVPYLTLRNGWSPRGMSKTAAALPKLTLVDIAELTVLTRASIRRRRLFL